MKLCFASVLGCLLWASLLVGCKKEAVKTQEVGDYGAEQDAVVQAVKSGELKPGDTGVVLLPEKWKSSSVTGQIHVAKDSTGSFLILFPIMQGSGSFHCLLYADNPPAGRTVQIGSMQVTLSGQSQGKYHQASIHSSARP
jgi:hypothetical protein